MVVRVLLFGPHAAAAGRGMVEVSLPDQSTCAALRDGLHAAVPALTAPLGEVLLGGVVVTPGTSSRAS